jgi:alpha-tubulin suppressor-like RCC1 family protein
VFPDIGREASEFRNWWRTGRAIRRAALLVFPLTAALVGGVEVPQAAAATPCLSISASATSVLAGTAVDLTAQCCNAAVPAVSGAWIWCCAGLLLVCGALLTRRAPAVRASGLFFVCVVTVATRPAAGQAQSCGGPFQWQAQSASETYSGAGPAFSFTPSFAGPFVVTLSDPTEAAAAVTIQVSSPITITAGTAHTCALTLETGGVKCWGFNSAGTLGNGGNQSSTIPTQVVSLTSGVLAIGGGGQHTCAASQNAGTLVCWGLNSSGQLGNGTESNSNVPVAVSGLPGLPTQIVGGDSHTCVLVGGSVYCWGDNSFGQLGTGTASASLTPVAVQGLPGPVQSIAAASDSTCAVLSTGDVYCWGFNDYGQLGNGGTQNSSVPVQMQGLSGAALGVGPGIEDTCVLAGAGVSCLGRNDSGQLGDGNLTASTTLQPVSTPSSTVAQLSGGQNFSCVVLTSGAVRCWGQNTRGQLGDNRASGPSSDQPVQVIRLTSGMNLVHAGYIHACATDGTHIWCWGWGTSGQLGNGQQAQSNVPVSVVGY